MIGADRALVALQRGSAQIADLWRSSGRKHRRIEEIRDLAEAVAWGISDDGQEWVQESGPVDAEARVVVLVNPPAPGTGIVNATFQASPGFQGDSIPTVYVFPCGFTTLWAGILLWHELDHALEYRDGDSVFGESDADWYSAEGRAHRHEAALVDAITGGRFVSEIEKTDLDSLLRRHPEDVASGLYRTLPAHLRETPLSDQEVGNRCGSLAMSAAMVAATAPQSVTDDTVTLDLGPAYQRANDAWSFYAG